MHYNLENLTWQEFEQLISLYLKSVVGEGVKSFDGTKDKGRDAIFNGTANAFPSETSPYKGNWIFQVKHRTTKNQSQKSVEQALLNNLASELLTVFSKHNHECDNYIYIVNIPASNTFEDKAAEIFTQFCNDNKLIAKNFRVISYSDLEPFILNNPQIRLRFPSTLKFSDLEAIFVRKEEVKNKGYLKSIRNDIEQFVSTTQYQEAIDRIYNNNVLMLVGNPKSGKTSIVNAIALSFLEESQHKPYFIRSTDEFFTIVAYLDSKESALFICDDIFGRHELDESKLDDWTDYFQSVIGSVGGGHKLLFTTRRDIYNEFERKSGLRSFFEETTPERYILKLNELSDDDRTAILDKHIITSRLLESYKQLLYSFKTEILQCKDFSPEIIRSLIQLVTKTTEQDRVPAVIHQHISNPNQYLYDFFENISEQKRLLLLSVAVAPDSELSSVEKSYNTLLEDTNTQPQVTFTRFIGEIDGSIVNKRDYQSSSNIDFYHPTMYDVMMGIFKMDQRYRGLMLSNLNSELFSLLTTDQKSTEKSNRIHLMVNEVNKLIIGIGRLIPLTSTLVEVIRLLRYFEILKIKSANDFRYFPEFKSMEKAMRSQLGSISFFETHQNAELFNWINLLDRWMIIMGKDFPEYFKHLEEKFQDKQKYDYWRLVFLIESIESGFIDTALEPDFLNFFMSNLSSLVQQLRSGLRINRENKPVTQEVWLPLFREIDDLIIKMKKSGTGKRLLDSQSILVNWEEIRKRSDFAKNRHAGMVQAGHWEQPFKKLRNYESIDQRVDLMTSWWNESS